MIGGTFTFIIAALLVGTQAFGDDEHGAPHTGVAKALFFIFATLASVSLLSQSRAGP